MELENNRKIRMGLIGGGIGSFIGKVHHNAAILDNYIELVCGAFSSDPVKSKESGKTYLLPDHRVYGNYEEMIKQEKNLPLEERMDFVAIVTPNHVHYGPAKMALENGFHVVCDKPMTFNSGEAAELGKLVESSGLVFALTHTYTGYPMVKHCREIVRSGKLGKIRKIIVQYTQGWLAEDAENKGNKQAEWRMDPQKAGVSCTMGDVGVHAANLIEYITELRINEVCADMSSFGKGRLLDDDGSVLIRLNNGAKGVLTASQICAGEENNLRIQVFGEHGGIEWHQMEPNTIELKWVNKSKQVIRTGVGDLSQIANAHTRVPAGHPEGYIEAFANIYRNFAFAVNRYNMGQKRDEIYDFPTVEDGIRGMNFIEKVIESGQASQKWVKTDY